MLFPLRRSACPEPAGGETKGGSSVPFSIDSSHFQRRGEVDDANPPRSPFSKGAARLTTQIPLDPPFPKGRLGSRRKSPSIPLFQRGKWATEITCQVNIAKCNKLPVVCRSLKLVMPNPGERVARHFPLCKRGTKGDLQSFSTLVDAIGWLG